MPRRSSLIRRTARLLALCLTVFAVAGPTWLAYSEHENSAEVSVATPAQGLYLMALLLDDGAPAMIHPTR
jgi:hypothetical protein